MIQVEKFVMELVVGVEVVEVEIIVLIEIGKGVDIGDVFVEFEKCEIVEEFVCYDCYVERQVFDLCGYVSVGYGFGSDIIVVIFLVDFER